MDKKNNRGSASVYMICLLIPTVICVCFIIRYAQLVSAKGMMADATGLAENAVLASYNHPIMDAYGLMCYTKSEGEMTGIANECLRGSLPGNIGGNVQASYTSACTLADDSVFLAQIEKYMFYWKGCYANNEISQIKNFKINVADKVSNIRVKMEEHYNNAVNAYGSTDIEISDELTEDRKNYLPVINVDDCSLRVGQVYMDYNGDTTDKISSVNRNINSDNTIADNVNMGIDMAKNVETYYEPLGDAITSQNNQNQKYELALYTYGNFTAFKSYGCTSLTGRYSNSGDMPSVCEWGENEFIINSSNDTLHNFDKTKYLIYESIFAEYIVGLYDMLYNDADINEYAVLAAGENVESIPVIKDEIIVGACSKLAYDRLTATYLTEGTMSYQSYMLMFDMVEAERDQSGFIDRVRHVIAINAANSPNAEAREFSMTNAWTSVSVTGSSANVDPSF